MVTTESTAEDVRKVTAVGESMEMSYYVCKPSRWTFQNDKIREWLLQFVDGRTLNACAGKTKLPTNNVVRNGLNDDRDAGTHHDVTGIAEHFDSNSFETIIYDPPFTQHQADDKYEGLHISSPEERAQVKREFHQLVKPGGKVIQFGYTTTNMPGQLGYSREAIAVFNTLGMMHDILGTVDRRLNANVQNP